MIRYVENPYDAVENADALLLLTEWSIFKAPDFNRIKKLLRIPLIIDGRNQYNSEAMTAMGFEYYGVGRGRKGIK
jgi:UDPglucose 6-dehydrogenase